MDRPIAYLMISGAIVALVAMALTRRGPTVTGGAPAGPSGRAPRIDGRFANGEAPPEELPLPKLAAFFLRRIRVALAPRPGAAPRVPYDAAAFARSPTLTWIGHSSFLVRMDGVTFLTDPMFSQRASPFQSFGPPRLTPPGVPLDALPRVDFVLLSHDHYDHSDFQSVKRLAQRGARFVVPMGLGLWVRSAGGEAIELDWWQDVELNGVRIHCVPAQHFSGRSLRDTGRRLWAGWVVAGPTRRFYHAGDTNRARQREVLARTTSGGVTINDTLLHYLQEDLPFGGIGASGMGAYHGRDGFRTFSHRKPVFRQARLNTTGLIRPPYGKLVERMIAALMR